MSIISIVPTAAGEPAAEPEPQPQPAAGVRRGAARVQLGRLRTGLKRYRAGGRWRGEADREEAEVLAWCRVQVRQMLRDGWTPEELAQVGISDGFLWRLGLTPDGTRRGYGSSPSGGTAAVSQTPLSLR